MKKTNKEILEFFGLKIGDKIKVEGYNNPFVILKEGGIQYAEEIREDCPFGSTWEIIDFICILHGNNYEIITPEKRIGDMRCKDFESCKECPLRFIYCGSVNSYNQRLFDIFKYLKENLYVDEEIEAIIEKRLNKEVKLNEKK